MAKTCSINSLVNEWSITDLAVTKAILHAQFKRDKNLWKSCSLQQRAASETFSIVRTRAVAYQRKRGEMGRTGSKWGVNGVCGLLTASRAHTLHLYIRGALMSVRKTTAPEEMHP